MNLNCLIVDDEPLARQLLTEYVKKVPFLNLIKACSSPLEAIEILRNHPVDLLFLDIQMPEITGITFLKTLQKKPMVIFTTAYKSYAVEGFDLDAIDYLVKPVALERLMRAIDKARLLTEMKQSIAEQDGFKAAADDSFFIKDKNTFVRINYSDVLYIESLGDFVNIFLQTGEKKIALVSMKNLEQQLPAPQFIRISRSQMVNKQKKNVIK